MVLNYEILPHTADLKIRIFGKTKEEFFLNALLAMEESLKPDVKQRIVKRKIKIKSLDLAALLVDFLSEVLYLNQVNKEVYFNLEFSKLTDNELEGTLFGKKVERFGEDIKAVTHHDLRVQQKKDGTWEATVLFDI